MNTAIVRTLATLCLIAALGSIGLMAQGPIQATIPFDFTIGKTSFTAGEYVVRPNMSQSVLAIQSVDGRSAAMTLTNAVQASKMSPKARLIFNRYGDRYFLSQVWAPGNQGRELSPSVAERELMAKTTSTEAVILVASSNK